jgi:hypothetical protein
MRAQRRLVPPGHRVDEAAQRVAQRRREARRAAEVDHRDVELAPLLAAEEVAGVGVGVEAAELEEGVVVQGEEELLEAAAAFRMGAQEAVGRLARDERGDQRRPVGAVALERRDREEARLGEGRAAQERGELLERPPLRLEVALAAHLRLEHVEVVPPARERLGEDLRQRERERAQQAARDPEVLAERALDAGVEQLDRDRPAAEPRAVDLADRRRRERRLVERLELRQPLAERGARLRRVERHPFDLQERKGVEPPRRVGEELPELLRQPLHLAEPARQVARLRVTPELAQAPDEEDGEQPHPRETPRPRAQVPQARRAQIG